MRLIRKINASLSRGERVFVWSWMLTLLVVCCGPGIAVASHGTLRSVGIAMSVVALVMFATPVSPLMRARRRRRGVPPQD